MEATMDGTTERIETVVIGGGQAGLAAGYHLAERGRPFVILDADTRIGGSWRDRWDSLVLFTPARYCGLPGWRFPLPGGSFPTKDDVADYLEEYASRFELPVRTDVRVDRVTRHGSGGFLVRAGDLRIEAENVIVATGANREPRVPILAEQLDPAIIQLHSSDYRRPAQLRDGGVLIVGAGNSGADIAMEVVREHATWLSGPDTGHVPVRIETAFARHVVFRLIRFAGLHILTVRTPIGRKARQKFSMHGGPLVRVKPKDLSAAGVVRVPRTAGVRAGAPTLEDGSPLDVTNVIWCTGFRQDLSWIDLPIFGEDGEPVHERGVAPGAPGLYFVGLPFQYAAASDVLPGVGRDAAYIAKRLADRRASPEPALATRSV
jgi:putative flavoprotein involved in K+ transport